MHAETHSITIGRKPEEVFDFLADINNWTQFSLFAKKVEYLGDERWLVHSPQGEVVVTTMFDRQRGLLDHYAEPSPGMKILFPYRVVPNEDQSELMFTLFQPPGLSDEHFVEQRKWVFEDFKRIKNIIESLPS